MMTGVRAKRVKERAEGGARGVCVQGGAGRGGGRVCADAGTGGDAPEAE